MRFGSGKHADQNRIGLWHSYKRNRRWRSGAIIARLSYGCRSRLFGFFWSPQDKMRPSTVLRKNISCKRTQRDFSKIHVEDLLDYSLVQEVVPSFFVFDFETESCEFVTDFYLEVAKSFLFCFHVTRNTICMTPSRSPLSCCCSAFQSEDFEDKNHHRFVSANQDLPLK